MSNIPKIGCIMPQAEGDMMWNFSYHIDSQSNTKTIYKIFYKIRWGTALKNGGVYPKMSPKILQNGS